MLLSNLLNRDDLIPVLNGCLPENNPAYDNIVPSDELIVLLNKTPFSFIEHYLVTNTCHKWSIK